MKIPFCIETTYIISNNDAEICSINELKDACVKYFKKTRHQPTKEFPNGTETISIMLLIDEPPMK